MSHNIPTLSQPARDFIYQYNGGIIPHEIRAELEKYIEDIDPYLVSGFEEMKQRFAKILKE
jgi:hypothetical protein